MRWQRNRPKGIKSCRACKTVRALAPELVPASCELCKPTDLDPDNQEVFDMIVKYPSMITQAPFGGFSVDISSVKLIADMCHIGNPLELVEAVEAAVRGLNG